MRLLIICPAHPPPGGIAPHVYWLPQEIAARGHAVQVISISKLYPSLLFPRPDRPINLSPLPMLQEFEAATRGTRDGRRLLFFGKVRRYKGLDVLLAAMPKVLARIDCELLVVGEFYEDVETYQRLIGKHGIE